MSANISKYFNPNSILFKNQSSVCKTLALKTVEGSHFQRWSPARRKLKFYIRGLVEEEKRVSERDRVIFQVHVQQNMKVDSSDQSFKLLFFNRMDTYSRFDHCTPETFKDTKLCICE